MRLTSRCRGNSEQVGFQTAATLLQPRNNSMRCPKKRQTCGRVCCDLPTRKETERLSAHYRRHILIKVQENVALSPCSHLNGYRKSTCSTHVVMTTSAENGIRSSNNRHRRLSERAFREGGPGDNKPKHSNKGPRTEVYQRR